MSSIEQNLIFTLHGAFYGISAAAVKEICWLPELYSLATAPPDIIGMFDWRSQLVPVMHLDLRFGHNFSGCNVTDRAIVVECQGTHVAIVAHDVLDVQSLAPQQFDLDLIQGRQLPVERNFVKGIARLNDAPVVCLDLDRLIREQDTAGAPSDAGSDFYQRCCPQLGLADRQIFATRARQLKTTIASTQSQSESGVLGVQIGAEYIGIPLELVVDVDTLDKFTVAPVPLAPLYVLGQTDWRGKILPILELGSVLQIPVLPRQEFVIIQIDEIAIGIAVDRIFDVLYLTSAEIDSIPTSVTSQLRNYLRGVTKYADNLMYLLKLQELVEREFLPANVAA